jgi:hypothetical protein
MLTIIVPAVEVFDEVNNEFIMISEETTLQLEHSLVSLSKWEAIWEKPFLSDADKTQEEAVSYIQAMTVTPDVPPEIYSNLSNRNYEQINELINAKMSATWFAEDLSGPRRREVITAELIYYWMFSFKIPKDCETWNLNRLFTQIKVFSEKNGPEKKMDRQALMRRTRELNAQRRKELGTSG